MEENTTNENDTHIPQELAADGREAGVELEEFNPFPFDAEKISISDKRVPLQTLIRRINQGSISAPLIQRGAGIWDDGQQSRLIESLMLRIPVPLFYVAEDENIHWKIVDGLQRVTAISRYVVQKKFALSGLEFLRELQGKNFDQLPTKFQNRIYETEFQFAIINPSTPQNVQRNVFKRLNTGGMPLTAQEIRHALYYGPSAVFLEELAKSNCFKKATTGSVNDSRMAARELILRFFAFLIRGVESYPKNEDMDDFLSGTMQLINLMPDLDPHELSKAFREDIDDLTIKYHSEDQLRKRFYIAMERASALFDGFAFRKSVPKQNRARTPINKSLFETWSVLLSEMQQEVYEKLLNNKERLYEFLEVATYSSYNDDLSTYISRDSHKHSGVRGRYDCFQKIIEITIGDYDLQETTEMIKRNISLNSAINAILQQN